MASNSGAGESRRGAGRKRKFEVAQGQRTVAIRLETSKPQAKAMGHRTWVVSLSPSALRVAITSISGITGAVRMQMAMLFAYYKRMYAPRRACARSTLVLVVNFISGHMRNRAIAPLSYSSKIS